MYCRVCDIEYPGALKFCKWCGGGLVDKESVGAQHCPACGSSVARDWLFCNECGVDLASMGAQPKDQVCPSCSTAVRKGWMYCRQCGEQIASERAERKCGECGAGMRDGWSFCKQCGTPADRAVAASPLPGDAVAGGTIVGIPAVGTAEDEVEPFSNLASGDLPSVDEVILAEKRRRAPAISKPPAAIQGDMPAPTGTRALGYNRSTEQLDERAMEREYADYPRPGAPSAAAPPQQQQGARTSRELDPAHAGVNPPAASEGLRTISMEALPPLPPPPPPVQPPPANEAAANFSGDLASQATVAIPAPTPDQFAASPRPPSQPAAPSFPHSAGASASSGSSGAFEQNSAPTLAMPALDAAPFAAPPPPPAPPAPQDATQVISPVAPAQDATRVISPPQVGAAGSDATTAVPSPFAPAPGPGQSVPVAPQRPNVPAPGFPAPTPTPANPTGKSGGGALKWVAIATVVVALLAVTAVAAIVLLRRGQAPTTPVATTDPAPVAENPTAPTTAPVDTPPAPQTAAAPAGMVAVPGATVTIGTDAADADVYSKPAHPVTLAPFFIDVNEVTNAEYKAFVDATKHTAPESTRWTDGAPVAGAEKEPVVGVTWNDASAYARWAGKRLPTEAEWEYAARGSDGRLYPWGAQWDASAGNFGKGESGSIAPVGGYPSGSSPFGTLDMIGNVWEWTSSDFAIFPGGAGEWPKNDAGKERRPLKVMRGGAFDAKLNITAAWRGFSEPERKLPKVGFRCAKDGA